MSMPSWQLRCHSFTALRRKPLREDAIFRIASMTKPIIAVTMLLLYEEGKRQLDDPVTKLEPHIGDCVRQSSAFGLQDKQRFWLFAPPGVNMNAASKAA
jgi:CubicO group peptidase (beta-lactamase class C family)